MNAEAALAKEVEFFSMSFFRSFNKYSNPEAMTDLLITTAVNTIAVVVSK
jgi:hypothetical protein